MIYFDSAHCYPLIDETKEFVKNLLNDFYPLTTQKFSFVNKTISLIEQSRILIANYLNTTPNKIFFTANEAIAFDLILSQINVNYDVLITNPCEEPFFFNNLKKASEKLKIPLIITELLEDSSINLKNLENTLKKSKKAFIFLSSLNIKTGKFFPLKRITNLCKRYNATFSCDISNTIALFPICLEDLGIDFCIITSHKIGSIAGCSVVYINDLENFKNLNTTFENEHQVVPGTENIYAISGLSFTFEFYSKNRSYILQKIYELKNYFLQKSITFTQYLEIFGKAGNYHPSFLNLKIFNKDIADLLLLLDLNNIYVSEGNFGENKNNLLISLSHQNTLEEIDMFFNVLSQIL